MKSAGRRRRPSLRRISAPSSGPSPASVSKGLHRDMVPWQCSPASCRGQADLDNALRIPRIDPPMVFGNLLKYCSDATNLYSVTRRQLAVGSRAAPRSGPCFLCGGASENSSLCRLLQPVLRSGQGDPVQMARSSSAEQAAASSGMHSRQAAVFHRPCLRDSGPRRASPPAHVSERTEDARGSRGAFRELSGQDRLAATRQPAGSRQTD